MASERTLVERAFDLAEKGECGSVSELGKKLKAEGFGGGLIERHLEGPSIRVQLSNLCREAHSKATVQGVDYVGRR